MMMMDYGQLFHWHRVYQQGGQPVKEFLKILYGKICDTRSFHRFTCKDDERVYPLMFASIID